MKESLLIYGAGGLGKEVLSLVYATDSYDVIGFLDDSIAAGTFIKGIKVLGGSKVVDSLDEPVNIVLALGSPQAKAAVLKKINSKRAKFPIIRHPSVILQNPSDINVGTGSILCAGSVLTTDITIGNYVLINLNCTVGHGVSIGDNSSIMPGSNIAGEVSIGASVLIGSGVNILNKVRVGDNSIVGMGSVVIHDVQAGTTVVGVPAKSLYS